MRILTLLAVQLGHRLLHAYRMGWCHPVIVDHAQQRWYLKVADLRIQLQDFGVQRRLGRIDQLGHRILAVREKLVSPFVI